MFPIRILLTVGALTLAACGATTFSKSDGAVTEASTATTYNNLTGQAADQAQCQPGPVPNVIDPLRIENAANLTDDEIIAEVVKRLEAIADQMPGLKEATDHLIELLQTDTLFKKFTIELVRRGHVPPRPPVQ